MRLTLAALLSVVVTTAAFAQFPDRLAVTEVSRISSAPIGTVDEIKRLQFPYRPIPVTMSPSSDSALPTTPSTSTTTPEPTYYKTAQGIVLGPGRWLEPQTSAHLQADHVWLTPSSASQVSSTLATSRVQVWVEPQAAEYRVFRGDFSSAPSTVHTYCLTLNLVGPGSANATLDATRVRVQVGGTSFTGPQLVVNGGTTRILFTCAAYPGPVTDIPVEVFVKGQVSTDRNANLFSLFSMQLVQMD